MGTEMSNLKHERKTGNYTTCIKVMETTPEEIFSTNEKLVYIFLLYLNPFLNTITTVNSVELKLTVHSVTVAYKPIHNRNEKWRSDV